MPWIWMAVKRIQHSNHQHRPQKYAWRRLLLLHSHHMCMTGGGLVPPLLLLLLLLANESWV